MIKITTEIKKLTTLFNNKTATIITEQTELDQNWNEIYKHIPGDNEKQQENNRTSNKLERKHGN
jgi:hypothetical protein